MAPEQSCQYYHKLGLVKPTHLRSKFSAIHKMSSKMHLTIKGNDDNTKCGELKSSECEEFSNMVETMHKYPCGAEFTLFQN